jgi:hypothetical protein|nr:MAG TPA: Rho termination factor, N-terminal domain [Caudoviricetes sp.]
MIKIIAGTYGYVNKKTGAVEAKDKKAQPFSCDKDEEARLVALGVAEYVEGVNQGEDPDQDPDGKGQDNGDAHQGDQNDQKSDQKPEKTLADMTKKELTQIATDLGIELPKKATNQDIIEAIEKARAEHEGDQGEDLDGEEDDDEAPALSAAMPE